MCHARLIGLPAGNIGERPAFSLTFTRAHFQLASFKFVFALSLFCVTVGLSGKHLTVPRDPYVDSKAAIGILKGACACFAPAIAALE